MKFKILLFGLAVMLASCEEAINEIIEDLTTGSSSLTISGDEVASLNYEEVEFIHSITSISGSELSGLDVSIGNVGTTETALVIRLGEIGNGTGFDAREYNYDPDADPIVLTATYATANDFYTINPLNTGVVNKLVLTKVTDTKIEGEVEFNLEDFSGDKKIKITGSFEALGITTRL